MSKHRIVIYRGTPMACSTATKLRNRAARHRAHLAVTLDEMVMRGELYKDEQGRYGLAERLKEDAP